MDQKTFIVCVPLLVALSGCGFDKLPDASTKDFSLERGLSTSFSTARGMAIVDTVGATIQVMVTDVPDPGVGCSYTAYAITDEGATALGNITLTASSATLFSGELMADAAALDIALQDVASVEVYDACPNTAATKIFTATITASSSDATSEAGSGHSH